MPRRERQSRTLIDLRLIENAELNRIHLELVGQFIQRRFCGVEPGHSTGSAHIGAAADVSLGSPKSHAQIGHTVLEWSCLAAVLMMRVKNRPRVDVIMMQR